jgi:hypothetical protein
MRSRRSAPKRASSKKRWPKSPARTARLRHAQALREPHSKRRVRFRTRHDPIHRAYGDALHSKAVWTSSEVAAKLNAAFAFTRYEMYLHLFRRSRLAV